MDENNYWRLKHQKYSQEDWIDKPSLFAQQAIKFFPNGGKLLDLAAGQGQDSRYFAKKGYEVWCTDYSDTALELASQKAVKEEVDINVIKLDLHNKFPFESVFFDVVFSNMGLHYFDDKTTLVLFSEITRVLKPGGILACLLNSVDDPEMKLSEVIEPGLYTTPSGLIKRFFDLGYLDQIVKEYFTTIIADKKGETYKDKTNTLVRFIGNKINLTPA